MTKDRHNEAMVFELGELLRNESPELHGKLGELMFSDERPCVEHALEIVEKLTDMGRLDLVNALGFVLSEKM